MTESDENATIETIAVEIKYWGRIFYLKKGRNFLEAVGFNVSEERLMRIATWLKKRWERTEGAILGTPRLYIGIDHEHDAPYIGIKFEGCVLPEGFDISAEKVRQQLSWVNGRSLSFMRIRPWLGN